MPVICPYDLYPEGHLPNDQIHKINGVLLGVLAIDLEDPNPSSIINGRVLESLYRSEAFIWEPQEFHVDLDVVSRNLFLIKMKGPSSPPSFHILGKPIEPMTTKHPLNASPRDFNGMISLKIPRDLFSSEMIGFSEVEDLVLDRLRHSYFYIFWTRLGIDEGLFPAAFIGTLPTGEDLSGNPKISACF